MDKKTSKVLNRISQSVPDRLVKKLIKTTVDTSEEEVAKLALKDPNIPKAQKDEIKKQLEAGAFRRYEEEEDEEVIKEIDTFNNNQVKKAIKNGIIPPPTTDKFINQRNQRMKKTTKLENSIITPVKNRIVVKPYTPPKDEKTKAGLYIPENTKKKSAIGTVVAVGPLVTCVAVGMQIAFEDYNYDQIDVAKQPYYIMKEDSILAILHENRK